MNPGDLATLDNVKAWLNIGGAAIAGYTQTNPVVISLVQPSGFLTGMPVVLEGVVDASGPSILNGPSYLLTLIPNGGGSTFSIPVDGTALPAYVSGGFASITDSQLQRLISAVSAYAQNVMNRNIATAAALVKCSPGNSP